MVLRTIRALAANGQTEILQLNMQDGGSAAEVICPQDWRTASELEDMATAFTRMAGVLRQYEIEGPPAADVPPAPEGGAQ